MPCSTSYHPLTTLADPFALFGEIMKKKNHSALDPKVPKPNDFKAACGSLHESLIPLTFRN